MRTTDWIAIYAALVATATLIWQFVGRRADRKPRVTVSLQGMLEVENEGEALALARYAREGERVVPVGCSLQADVTNVGREKVTITVVAVIARQSGIAHRFEPTGDLPWTLDRGAEAGFAFTIGPGPITNEASFHAEAYLTTGESFESPPLKIGDKNWLIQMPATILKETLGADLGGVYQVVLHDVGEPGDQESSSSAP